MNNKPMSKNNEQLQLMEEERKKFWKDPRTRNIFNLFVQGDGIASISETLSMKPSTIETLITNKFFIVKLEAHIRGVLFTNQVAKVIAASDVFSKLWDRVTNNINDIPVEICLKELTKLFPSKKEGMIINPKKMNVFMNVLKDEATPANIGERLSDMEDDMGFEGLEEDSKAIYPELDVPENTRELREGEKKDGIKQGDPSMDQEKSSTNQ